MKFIIKLSIALSLTISISSFAETNIPKESSLDFYAVTFINLVVANKEPYTDEDPNLDTGIDEKVDTSGDGVTSDR